MLCCAAVLTVPRCFAVPRRSPCPSALLCRGAFLSCSAHHALVLRCAPVLHRAVVPCCATVLPVPWCGMAEQGEVHLGCAGACVPNKEALTVTVSAGALDPARNPAGKAAHPWPRGRADTVGLWRLLGLWGEHPSQPCIWEGTVPAAPVVGHTVCGSVMGMPEQPRSSPDGAGGPGRAGAWARAAGRVSLSAALKSPCSAWKESLKTLGPPTALAPY